MKNHENNKRDWTACAKVVAGTHQSVLWCFPCHIPASLGQVGCDRPGPPASERSGSGGHERKPFDQGATHTQVAVVGAFSKTGGRLGGCVLFDTLRRFAALWHKTESSHLKSLRNKRKERQKEQR